MAINPNPNLPEDILFDIFSRLPTKSIGKFRCVSKPWRALLSTPNFIKFHLTRKTHKRHLLLISPSDSLHAISTFEAKKKTVSKKLNLSNTWSAVVGSCNGLVLLVNQEGDIFLVNPVTHEHVKVPHSPLALPYRESFRMHGFGYDSSSDDYKIVTLSYYITEDNYSALEPDSVDTLVDVYSLKSGVWRRLGSSPYEHAFPFPSPGAFVNGALHWLARSRESGKKRSVIVAFDLGREEFYEIPAPIISDYRTDTVVVVEGSLCMTDTSRLNITFMWMLKEYRKKGSWTKITFEETEIIKPLCFIGNEKVVMIYEMTHLLVYRFEKVGWSAMFVDGAYAKFTDGCTFTESLLSPDFRNEIEGNILH